MSSGVVHKLGPSSKKGLLITALRLQNRNTETPYPLVL